MRVNFFVLGIIFLALPAASAEGLLKPTCINTFTSDFAAQMWIGDLNGDGTNEVVVGSRLSGIVNSYKYKGYDCNNDWGAVQSGGWSYATGGDIQSMWVGDLSNDRKMKVVVNGIDPILNPNAKPVQKFVTVIAANGNEEWNLKEQCGVSYSVYAADVDGTGVKNVMMGTKSSKVCVLKDNVKTKEPILWSYLTARPVYVVKADDIDGDGKVEVVALDRQGYSSTVYCLSSTGALKWKYVVEGGVHIASTADKILQIADLEGDGKKEVLVGTFAHGVDVLDSSGSIRWNFKTGSSSNSDLVSIVYPADINNDRKTEILVGAKPYIYALDSSGSLKWSAPVDTMVYGIAVGDITGNSDPEVVVSSTRYLDVFTNRGSKIDRWAYTVEIQGRDVKFAEKDVNGLAVGVADLNGDGASEVVASFGWQEDRDIFTYYYGDLRVFKVDKNFNTQTSSTVTTLAGSVTPTTMEAGKNVDSEPTPEIQPTGDSSKGGGLCCLPALPILFALGLSLLLGYPVR